MTNKQQYNEQIIKLISEYLQGKGKALRFNQLMYILNGTEDWFNEEPQETLKRFQSKLNGN